MTVHPQQMKQAWAKKMTQLGHKVSLERVGQGQNSEVMRSPKTKSSHKVEDSDSSSLTPRSSSMKEDNGEMTIEDKEFDDLDLETLTVGPSNTPILVEALPETMLDKVRVFYVCATCGKVWWEGGHYGRVRDYLENYIHGYEQENSELK